MALRLLKIKEVLSRFPVSKSAWFLGIRQGKYPRPLKLSARAVAWLESDVEMLISELVKGQRILNEK